MKYTLKLSQYLEIELNNDNELIHAQIWNNFDKLSSYIVIDKFRHLKLAIKILKIVNVNNVIKILDKHNVNVLKHMIYKKYFSLFSRNLPLCISKYISGLDGLDVIYKHCSNEKYCEKIIRVLGYNVTKITVSNVKNVCIMFNITILNNVTSFDEWGPGNNGTVNKNIINHYNKHVLSETEGLNWGNINLESYKNFAIIKSKQMVNKTVHLSPKGIGVYFSGTIDDVFIVGRINSDKLGISSCYIMNNKAEKMKVIKEHELWSIKM